MTATTIAPSAEARSSPQRAVTVSVGRLRTIEGTEDQLLMAAAAAAPLGSQDPADRALLRAAAAQGDLRHVQQLDAYATTPETKLSIATVCGKEDPLPTRIVRGAVSAVIAATDCDLAASDEAHRIEIELERQGFRALAVAATQLSPTGEPVNWQLLGIIPLKVVAVGKPRIHHASYDWVYVRLWDPALRLMHWTAVLCIVTLVGTGYMIATPFIAPGTGAPQPYLMGYVRVVHYSAAWILIATAIVRFVDLFISPYPYARWRSLWPINNKVEFKATVDVFKGYLFLKPHRNPTWIGLNPLQAITYTAVYGLALFMVFSGMALYGLYNPNQWPYSWFQWLNWWLGADMVRTLHYIGMWLFLIFVPAHIYLSARSDTIDRGGAISSMINGGVWIRKNAPVIDADHYSDKQPVNAKE